jgi:hypothetical protein
MLVVHWTSVAQAADMYLVCPYNAFSEVWSAGTPDCLAAANTSESRQKTSRLERVKK